MGFIADKRDSPNAATTSPGFVGVALATMSSLLFLGGGLVTYVLPIMTPPFYIAGSVAMFANAVVMARLLSQRRRRVRPERTAMIGRLAIVVAVLGVAFSVGFLV